MPNREAVLFLRYLFDCSKESLDLFSVIFDFLSHHVNRLNKPSILCHVPHTGRIPLLLVCSDVVPGESFGLIHLYFLGHVLVNRLDFIYVAPI